MNVTDWHRIAHIDELKPGDRKHHVIEGIPIAVFNLNGNLHAIVDSCTHLRLPLSDGYLEGHHITCPFHGAMFDLLTGEALCAPATGNLVTCEVRVQNESVEVKLPLCPYG